MAVTTVTSTERVLDKKVGLRGRTGSGNGRNGRGPFGGGGGKGGDDGFNDDRPAEKYRIGIWVVLAGVAMMFTALSSAYIVRSVSIDGSHDWQPIAMPPMLWLSTGTILLSSVTFSLAQRNLKSERREQYRYWLSVTGVLGVGFLVSQLLSWRELVAHGIYLSSNPHSSFFYLLTAVHGIHLIFGLLGLSYVLFKAWRKLNVERREFARRTAGSDAVAIYWHFMDGLWIYLFLLLFVWR
jgi:cytochrome c oxidase subunit 3